MSTNKINLTSQQQNVLNKMLKFAESTDSKDRVFILKGFAGTGKTTLMRFLTKQLTEKKRYFRLLATTGRAAKILSNLSDNSASTIHSMIYTFTDLNKDLSAMNANQTGIEETGQIFLNFEPVKIDISEDQLPPCIYIIDESSMISDIKDEKIVQAKFGTGQLLKELLDFDARPESKFIFIGDPCQLPPVKSVQSPALDKDYFSANFNITAQECTLTEIIRQKDGSSLIPLAQQVRKMCETAPKDEYTYGYNKVWGRLPFRNSKDVKLYADIDDMTQGYLKNIKQFGFNNAIIICQSNKKCSLISQSVRESLGLKNTVQKGDLLMVVQNNYPTGLMNGDMVEVLSVDKNIEKRANLIFQNIVVKELFTQHEYNTLFLTSTLTSSEPNLGQKEQTELFIDFVMRMKKFGITQKTKKESFKNHMLADKYLNALRCSYGYAVTCHKAQGGEWENVYVDLGNMLLNPTTSKYQWIYTSITRAKKTLHLLDKFYIR